MFDRIESIRVSTLVKSNHDQLASTTVSVLTDMAMAGKERQ